MTRDLIIKVLIFSIVLINVGSFFVVAVDKYKAKHRMWRIPEKVLFALGVFGGCPGVYLGFLAFNHKTRHMKFMIGIPVIFALQVLIVGYFLMKR